VNFDVSDLCRFLAKVAHGYTISRFGIDGCSQYFLPSIILGNTLGALTYVGGNSQMKILEGGGVHGLIAITNDCYRSVQIQLFRDGGDPPPVYEVVVGRI
jgi:hypothetical protein